MTAHKPKRRNRWQYVTVTVTHADGRVEKRQSSSFRKPRRSRSGRFKTRKSDYAKHWYLRTEHWPEVRLQTKIRDGFRCVECGTGKALHVHHLTYERKGVEWLEDLITLCGSCHESTHGVT